MLQQGVVRNQTKYIAPFAVMLIAAIALLGWWTNHTALAAWLPAIANMTFNTALIFLILGMACAVPTQHSGHQIRLTIGAIIAVIAAMSLLQDLFSISFGIDNLLFDSRAYQPDSPYPGRMSSITATGFLLAAISLFCLTLRQQQSRLGILMHGLILLIALIGMLGLGMNLLMARAPEPFVHVASISAMTATAFLLLAAALLNIFHQCHSSDGHPILHVGIRLMLALKYPQKFAIISIIFAMPLLLLVWNELATLERDIEQARLKITGIEHIHQTIDLLNAIPLHRGMLNTHLADRKLFIRALQQSRVRIDQLFAANDVMDQQHRHEIAIPHEWGKIEQRWVQIKQSALDPPLAWRLHTEIISLLHQHLRDIGKSTQLAYDSDLTIHNLVSAQVDVLPQLFEQISQLRGLGSGIIASGKIEHRQQLMQASDISRTMLLLEEYQQLIDSTWTGKRPVPNKLRILNRDFIVGCTSFLAVAEAQLVGSESFTTSSQAYFEKATTALTAGFAFNHASLQYVQQLLQQRISQSINRQYLIKLSILLAALLLLYLFSAFYQSIMHSIDMFNHAIEDIRQGESNKLALLPARDEMVHAFNTISTDLIRISSQMSAIVDHAVDSIITINADGIIQSFNPAAEQQFGYTGAEIKGKNITILMPERYRDRHVSGLRHYMDVADSDIVGNALEAHGLKKDTSEFPIHISISTMLMEGERTFISIIRDITRHNELEHELRQAQKMQAVGVLVGGVAHNFNNMLAGIVGQAYLAKMRIKDNPKAIKHLDTIEKTSVQAGDMVKQLLTFAHKDFLHNKQDISLDTLITEGFKTARLGMPEDISLGLRVTDTDLMVHCDANQIQQVLINMVNNARDAVDSSFTKKISIKLQRYEPDAAFYQRHPKLTPGSYAALHISDTGHGMDKETIDQIFEPFFTMKGVGSGTGLGLSTAFGSISSHHGVIEVESQSAQNQLNQNQPDQKPLQQGSTFRIYLPLVKNEEAAPQEQESNIRRSKHSETLLLVDDEKLVLESICKVLEQLGYSVVTACDGRQGLQRFLEHQDRIKAVITDVVMPRSGGVAMFHQIHAIDNTMPVIFLTGYDQGRVSLQPDEEAFSTLISKPVSVATLSQQIRTMLESAASGKNK